MKKLIVFDLDDTLYNEIDFLKSAYLHIAKILDEGNNFLYNVMLSDFQNKKDVFEILSIKYKISKIDLLNIYRSHFPTDLPSCINLPKLLLDLRKEGMTLGLITDGRSITQRNKLKALNIENLFDKVVISEEFGYEKPSKENFLVFENFGERKFYIGDNISKDFIAPNKLGWTTICLLDQGKNIHKQTFSLPNEYLPKHKINSLHELNSFI